jgi:hypothetical protein
MLAVSELRFTIPGSFFVVNLLFSAIQRSYGSGNSCQHPPETPQPLEIGNSRGISAKSDNCDSVNAVVSTLPVGVSKAGDVTFTPPLPASKQWALDHRGVGDGGKMFMEFSSRVWPTTTNVFSTEGVAGEIDADHDPVPEPGSVPMLVAGAGVLTLLRRVSRRG